MRVSIIGGGVGGLAAAYDLARRGVQVTVYEREAELGGEAGTFPIAGTRVERFYHHLFATDTDAIGMLKELGLASRLRWRRSRMGLFYDGRVYSFGTPWELLRFAPLSPLDRLRFGLVVLYLRRFQDWPKLEGLTAQEWLLKYAGKRIYEVVWGPLLRGKFGAYADEVSMVWFWGKIHQRGRSRGRTLQHEELAYIDGSFQVLIDGLADTVRRHGGAVRTATAVRRVVVANGEVKGLELEEPGAAPHYEACDCVLATVPSPIFLALAPDLPPDYRELLARARYHGALCLVLVLKQPLTNIYWLNISDRSMPFVLAVEHTNFVPAEAYEGKRILYLSNYFAPGHPFFSMSAEHLIAEYAPHLRRLNPHFREDWIEAYHLFSDLGAQPIVARNYSAQLPPHSTPIRNLYLANTTQIYPEDRGTSYSIRLGRKVAELILREADFASERAAHNPREKGRILSG